MEQLLVKAGATVTSELGEFSAIAAAYSVDRVKDRIVPGAFGATIGQWQQSGKRIPLHWNHEGDAKSIIGSIDPVTMRETTDGLYVEGKVDLEESETAREAWRSMKNGAMSLSFGYMNGKSRKVAGGVTELLAIDLFEISIVPIPANPDTRVLSLKTAAQQLESEDLDPSEIAGVVRAIAQRLDEVESVLKRFEAATVEVADKEPDGARSVDPLRQKADAAAFEVALGGLEQMPSRRDEPQQPVSDLVELSELKQRSRSLMLEVLSGVSQHE